MVVLRSGKVLGSCSSSSTSRAISVASIIRDSMKFDSSIWAEFDKAREDPYAVDVEFEYEDQVLEALEYHNQHSSHEYKLVKITDEAPVFLMRGMLVHTNFTAINTHVAHAPEEMFFAEFTLFDHFSVRLCLSLGPINSLSGDQLKGCFYCRGSSNLWHPKSCGFVRGGDELYKSLQDICDINHNNAIANHQILLPMSKQVSRFHGLERERTDILELVDDDGLYATEALKSYNRGRCFKLVNPGPVTCVVLPTCLLFHVNFKAKETYESTAPEEMFFAEMISINGVISCKICSVLTPSALMSEDETGGDKTNGCYYCHEFNNVRHCDQGYVRGGDSFYMSEKELLEKKL